MKRLLEYFQPKSAMAWNVRRLGRRGREPILAAGVAGGYCNGVFVKTLAMLFLSATLVRSQTPFWEATNGIAGGAEILSVAADSDGYAFVGTFVPTLLYRSADDGLNWSPTSLTGKEVYGIAFAPGGLVFAAAWDGMYRSTNYGLDWSSANSGLESLNLDCVARSPSGILYTGSVTSGIFRSSNNGASWEPAGLDGKWISTITIDAEQTIYVNAEKQYSYKYRSTDSGSTWILIDSTGSFWSFAPTRDGGVFAGGLYGTVLRTTDAGATWVKKSNGLPASVSGRVAVDGEGSIYAFAGNYGIYRSSDLGDTWTRVDRRLAWAQGTFPAKTSSGDLIVGTENGGVFRSYNHGTMWRQSSTGLGYPSVPSLTGSRSYLFAATPVGVFRSADNGRTWTQVDTGFVPFKTYALTQDVDHHIYAAAYYLFRTNDDGASWSTTSPGNAIYVTLTANRTILVIDYYLDGSPTPMDFYTRLRRSTDDGTTWTTVLDDHYQIWGSVFAVRDSLIFWRNMRSTDDGKTWQSVIGVDSSFFTVVSDSSGLLIAGGKTGILHSTDGGSSWKQVASLGAPLRTLALGGGSSLFAGTEGRGIFASTDQGRTWTEKNTGLADSTILSMILAPDGRLVIGTKKGGVYRSADPVTSVHVFDHSPTLVSYILEQNYPNPFNPSTTITFELPMASVVRLSVYDILGREVSVLVDERRDAGVHEVKFDGSRLASGVYFYRLQARQTDGGQAGDFVQTTGLLLLK
jgi:photosystem II stability/assembly factor-like uncharacterized protein